MAGGVEVLPYGERACLLAVRDGDDVLGLDAAVRAAVSDGLVETVPGATSVLVVFASPDALRAARSVLADLGPATSGVSPTGSDGPVEVPPVDVPVTYDGDDLDAVAETVGCSVEEVVTRHTAPDYRAAFGGFAPGFAYLAGLDPRLHVARRDSPRTRVPAGSVAIAAEHSAIYPVASPGGWSLLGRTDLAVWDVDRDPPALLRPGTRVRFTAVRA